MCEPQEQQPDKWKELVSRLKAKYATQNQEDDYVSVLRDSIEFLRRETKSGSMERKLRLTQTFGKVSFFVLLKNNLLR